MQKKLKKSVGVVLLVAGMFFILVSILAGVGIFTTLLGAILLLAGFFMLPSSPQ